MECSRFEQIADALYDGELPPPEAEKWRGHLESCRECAGRLDRLAAVDSTVRSWTPREPSDWRQLEGEVLAEVGRIEARRRQVRIGAWWASAAAATIIAASAAWVVFRDASPGPAATVVSREPAPETPPEITHLSGRSTAPLRKLSSAEESDARTLYYTALSLLKNGDEERAATIFAEIRSEYQGSGLAFAAAFHEAVLADKSVEIPTAGPDLIRSRLEAWEAINEAVLEPGDVEVTLRSRALYSWHVYSKTRSAADKARARYHADAYVERFGQRSREVQSWLEALE